MPLSLLPTLGAAVAAVMALAVLAYVVVRGTRRRRAADDQASAPVEPPRIGAPLVELVEVPADPDTEDAIADTSAEPVEPVPLGALQLHVRTLETALEEQSTSLARAEALLDEGSDLQRVLLTIDALRERVTGSPESESVLNRVHAAVTRLAATSVADRPALPIRVAGAPAALPAAARLPISAPASTPLPAAPRAVAPVSESKVLPVPAPLVESVSRGSRWRRRGAA